MHDPSQGSVIDPYHRGKKIGEGSFGVIFEGTNLLNNQQVAIKFVSRVLARGSISGRCLIDLEPILRAQKERLTSF